MLASSVALGVVLVLLTVVTQLQLDRRTWHRAWRVVKEACSCPRVRREKVEAAERLPGRKARRTQRRRERRAIMKDQANEQSQRSQTSDRQQPSIPIPAPTSPKTENTDPSVSYYHTSVVDWESTHSARHPAVDIMSCVAAPAVLGHISPRRNTAPQGFQSAGCMYVQVLILSAVGFVAILTYL